MCVFENWCVLNTKCWVTLGGAQSTFSKSGPCHFNYCFLVFSNISKKTKQKLFHFGKDLPSGFSSVSSAHLVECKILSGFSKTGTSTSASHSVFVKLTIIF